MKSANVSNIFLPSNKKTSFYPITEFEALGVIRLKLDFESCSLFFQASLFLTAWIPQPCWNSAVILKR